MYSGELRVVLCWHMHQPEYRDHLKDEFQQPWTYLHAIKDYTDMAAHLEAVPGAKAVVNFSPVLLDQLDHYQRQFEAYRRDGSPLRDPLLAALETAEFPAAAERRLALLAACQRANRKHMIEPYPVYARLVRVAESVGHDEEAALYLSDQFLADILTWYHLVWLGDSVRTSVSEVQRLIAQEKGYTLHDRRQLVTIIGEQIASLRVRYRRLAESGRVELSTSPFGHPMLPLLIDFGSSREALPDSALPLRPAYPGGTERAAWHIMEGRRAFERYFALSPAGCWPSEGGLSDAALDLLDGAGFAWTATGESVLRNSLRQAGLAHDDRDATHFAWQCRGLRLNLFARNDALSDLIGFTYANWHADDAVGDLVHRLEQIPQRGDGEPAPVVSIIMDGENAWEHYPRNGHYFLSALYRRLSDHPRIRMATYSEIVGEARPRELRGLVAGSWVYGTFSTWMGDADKNRAWDILAEAKLAFDDTLIRDAMNVPELAKQLAACEGSDWFWWLGAYNPAAAVSDMERLFRTHVANLYQLLKRDPPLLVSRALSQGRGTPELGGTMRRGSEV